MESEDRKPIFTKRLILIILAVILLILIIFLLLRKCGPGSGGGNYNVSQIILSPTSIGLEEGQTYPISSTVLPQDAKDKSLVWSSSNPEVATVDPMGLVTAVGEGTATITAGSYGNSGVTGQTVVTVSSSLPKLEQLQLNKSTYSVKVGKTVLVEVTPIPSTALIEDIKYTIEDENIATVDTQGVIKGVKAGTTSLIVTANNGTIVATSTVKVTKASNVSGGSTSTNPSGPTDVVVTGIILPSDGCYKMKVNSSYTLSAVVTPTNATNPNVSWESSDEDIATVSSTGKVTAKNRTGTAIIKVTASSGVYSTYEIRVVPSSSREGSCTASGSNGNNDNNNNNDNDNDHYVTNPSAGQERDDAIVTNPTGRTEIEYLNQNYSFSLQGVLTDYTPGANGYYKEAKCHITLAGGAPYYELEVDGRTFYKQAVVPARNGGVEVKIKVFSSESAVTGVPIETRTVTVCSKVGSKEVKIDNAAPTCTLSYNPSSYHLLLSCSDNGSGLKNVVWENSSSKSFSSGGSAERNIRDELESSIPHTFTATVYDKADNAAHLSLTVDNIARATETDSDAASEAATRAVDIDLILSNTSVIDGNMVRFSTLVTYEDGRTVNIDACDTGGNFEFINNYGAYISLDCDYLDTVVGEENNWGNDQSKEVTIQVRHFNGIRYIESSASLTIYKSGGAICTPSFTVPAGEAGGWVSGKPTVTCDAQSDDKISAMGICTAAMDGTCTPNVSSTGRVPSKTMTGSDNLNGPHRICWSYKTPAMSEKITDCSTTFHVDNTAPSITISKDMAKNRILVHANDGAYSSGITNVTINDAVQQLTSSAADAKNDWNSSFPYDQSYGSKIKVKVKDAVGKEGSKEMSLSLEDIAALLDESTGTTVYMKEHWVIGEIWQCDSENGCILNPDNRIGFRAGVDSNDENHQYPETETSILNALKKYDDDVVLNWYSTSPFKLNKTQGYEVTGSFTGAGTATVTVCLGDYKNDPEYCASQTVKADASKIPPKKIIIKHTGTMTAGMTETLEVQVVPYNTAKDVIITSSDNSVISVSGNKITARSAGKSATITVKSAVAGGATASKTIKVEEFDKNIPSLEIASSEDKYGRTTVLFSASDVENNVTLKYNLVKGTSCTPTSVLDRGKKSASYSEVIKEPGVYTACAQATDAAGNKTDVKRTTIDASAPISGKILCSVSGVRDGSIRIGKAALATITCTSAQKINVSSLNFINSNTVTVTSSKSEVTGTNNYRVIINVTTRGVKKGNATVALAAGSLSTSTDSNSQVSVGSYEIIEETAPTIKSSCSISYDKASSKLTASVTAENVQTMTYDTSGWTSASGNKYQKTIDKNKEAKYTFSAQIWYKDGRAAEKISCSYTHKPDGTTDEPLAAPTVSYGCSTASYDGSTWCKYGLAVNVSGVPSGATKKQCRVSGSGSCDPFTGSYSTITSSGTYTVCAGYVKNNKNSQVGCKTITAKIDTIAPTCSITLGTYSGTTMNLTAKVTEKESGLSSGWTSGWTNNAEGYYTTTETVPSAGETKTITFTVKDKVGNQGTCSVKITGKRQCKSGYSEISGGASGDCYKYAKEPSYDWEQRGGGLYPAKPSRTNTETIRYEHVQVDASQCYGQYGTYVTQCWKETVYSRGIPTCTGTYLINNKCYWRTSKIVVPTVTQ